MTKGIIAILIGIGIVIYNHSGGDSRLVLRGTGLDFGYIAITYGVIVSGISLARSGKSEETKEIE